MRKLAFLDACRKGMLGDAIESWDMLGRHRSYVCLQTAFFSACDGGHLDVAKWIYFTCDGGSGSVNTVNVFDGPRFPPFFWACENGHLVVAEWLWELGGVPEDPYKWGTTFMTTCARGKLDAAQWLWALCLKGRFLGRLNWAFDMAFAGACGNGHMDTATWLWSLGDINPHHDNDRAFRLACACGHLHVAQWVWELCGSGGGGRGARAEVDGDLRLATSAEDPVNHHADLDFAFRFSCLGRHTAVARWVWSLGGVDHHANNDQIFRQSCEMGNFEMAHWMVELGGIRFQENPDYMAHLRRKWRGAIRAMAVMHRTFADLMHTRYAPGGKGYDERRTSFEASTHSMTTLCPPP